MANPYLILWCDPSQNKIYSGWQKNTQAPTPVLKQGDEIGCEIHWVRTGDLTAVMQELQFPPSATLRLAVGRLDATPLGGTFTITYDGDTTDALAYSITATELQTALNDLASITAEGGVTVSKNGNQFRIVWNDAGVVTTSLTADLDMLYPTSQASVIEARAGSATASRILLFKIKQSAIAAQTTFTAVTPPAITSTVVFSNTWRISIDPAPKEGVFSITVVKGATTYTTASIAYNADAFTVSSALENLAVVENESFSVVKTGDYTWDISAPAAVDSITVTNGLVGFSAMYGVLNMNTAEVEEFLAGTSGADAVLEVEADVGGEIQTLVQTKVRVINDLIDTSSFTLVDMGSVMPVDSVVRYDTSQALTSAQQLTARQNIDAASVADISAAFDLTNIPTNNEKAAMQYSVLPSQSNPFVTMSERNPFDQDLNTTDDVQFNTVTVGTNTVVIDGNSISVSEGANTLVVEPTGITFPDASVQTTSFDPSLYLTKAGNLSGIASLSTARTNLGLGTMAVETASNYLAKADNLSGLASTSTARTNLGLGTMAVATATDYLAKADNLSGLTSLSTARYNLGLGTMAQETATNYLAKADNLSGLTNQVTARQNIGLGTSNSPQFSALYIGGTSGAYGYLSSSSFQISDITGAVTTISASGISNTGGPDGIYISRPLTSEISSINRAGVNNTTENGIWYYGNNGNETGLTKDGVVFPDGTVQSTANNLAYRDLCVYTWETSVTTNGSAVATGLEKQTSGVPNNGQAFVGIEIPKTPIMTFYFDFEYNCSNADTVNSCGAGVYYGSLGVSSPRYGFYFKPATSTSSYDGMMMFRYYNGSSYTEVDVNAHVTGGISTGIKMVFNGSSIKVYKYIVGTQEYQLIDGCDITDASPIDDYLTYRFGCHSIASTSSSASSSVANVFQSISLQ